MQDESFKKLLLEVAGELGDEWLMLDSVNERSDSIEFSLVGPDNLVLEVYPSPRRNEKDKMVVSAQPCTTPNQSPLQVYKDGRLMERPFIKVSMTVKGGAKHIARQIKSRLLEDAKVYIDAADAMLREYNDYHSKKQMVVREIAAIIPGAEVPNPDDPKAYSYGKVRRRRIGDNFSVEFDSSNNSFEIKWLTDEQAKSVANLIANFIANES